jgi:hypothetical protein
MINALCVHMQNTPRATLNALIGNVSGAVERCGTSGTRIPTPLRRGAVGLLLGGALTEYLSWRWTLYVNLACVRVTGRGPVPVFVPEPSDPADPRRGPGPPD